MFRRHALNRTALITDLCEAGFRRRCGDVQLLEFLPDAEQGNIHAWWRLSPGAIAAMLRVVGFNISSKTTNAYKFKGRDLDMVTLVADRIAV
jgi:hypothetical protein